VRGDLAEEAQDPRLVAPLLLPVREVEGPPRDRHRIIPAAGQKMRLAELGQKERMVDDARRLGVRECLLHEGHALREAARQRIRVPEMRRRDVKVIPYLGRPAQLHGALERRNGLGDSASTEGDEAQVPVGIDEAGGMIDLACDPDGFLTVCHRIHELAQLGEAPGEPRSRGD